MIQRRRWPFSAIVLAISTLAGLLVVVAAHLLYWNWYGFSASYTFVTGLDTIVAFFLLGLAIARWAVPAPQK